VETDIYQPPGSDLQAELLEPSRRRIHCSIAWISGFLICPILYWAMLLSDDPGVQRPTREGAWVVSLLTCVIAASIAAFSVMPFRRVPAWLAVLAGFVPQILFVVFVVVESFF